MTVAVVALVAGWLVGRRLARRRRPEVVRLTVYVVEVPGPSGVEVPAELVEAVEEIFEEDR